MGQKYFLLSNGKSDSDQRESYPEQHAVTKLFDEAATGNQVFRYNMPRQSLDSSTRRYCREPNHEAALARAADGLFVDSGN